MSLLALTLGFVSCSDNEEGSGLIKPVKMEDEIAQTIYTELPIVFSGTKTETVIVINSIEKLREVFGDKANLLTGIDFNTCTLIVGFIWTPSSGWLLEKQEIDYTEGVPMLDLYLREPDGGNFPAFSKLFYGGIYPQIQTKELRINKIKE